MMRPDPSRRTVVSTIEPAGRLFWPVSWAETGGDIVVKRRNVSPKSDRMPGKCHRRRSAQGGKSACGSHTGGEPAGTGSEAGEGGGGKRWQATPRSGVTCV